MKKSLWSIAFLSLIRGIICAAPNDPLAGAVVRSREYVVHRSPHKVEEFIGDVYYRNGDKELNADWASFDHKSHLWHARGHLHGVLRMKDGSMLRIWGDEAEHNTVTGKGWLKEINPSNLIRFTHEQGNLKDEGVAHWLEWNQTESRGWAHGDAHVWGGHGEAWAETAEFRDPEKILLLTQRRPVVVHSEPTWYGAIQGERIRAYENQHRLEADNHVRGWILFRNVPKEKSKA